MTHQIRIDRFSNPEKISIHPEAQWVYVVGACKGLCTAVSAEALFGILDLQSNISEKKNPAVLKLSGDPAHWRSKVQCGHLLGQTFANIAPQSNIAE